MKYITLTIATLLMMVSTISAQVKVSGTLIGGNKQNISRIVNRYPAIFDQTNLDSQTDETGNFTFNLPDLGRIASGYLAFESNGISRDIPIEGDGDIKVFIDGTKVTYKSGNVAYLDFLNRYNEHFSDANKKEMNYSDTDPIKFSPLIDSLAKSRIEYINRFKNVFSDTTN